MRTFLACLLIVSLSLLAGCRPRFRGVVKPPAAKPVSRNAAKPAPLRNGPSKAKPGKRPAKEDPALTEGLDALDKEDYDRAIALFTQAIERNGRNAQAYYYRASAYASNEEDDKAMADVNKAIELDQTHDGAYTLRGWLYGQKDDFNHAIEDCSHAIRLNPKSADAFATRASAYEEKEEHAKAIDDYKSAVRLNPEDADSHFSLAWILATCHKAQFRNGSLAVEHATKACKLSNYKDAAHLDGLAAAYAESSNFKEAIEWEQKALAAAGDIADDERDEMRARLELYQQGKPFREE
ncbi:MAG TPA: tetratricopeptide repeat protein [Gemmataceae bacterium]|jgi:tetratricopeptide (TPR) repeat protein|nr:tetratricopeptide repeat protein [Gemmataceae bacterium]